MSILSFLSSGSTSFSKEDLCQVFDGAPYGATIRAYQDEAKTVIYCCNIPRSDAWEHTSGLVVQASLKSEEDMKAWHEKTRVTEAARQGAADIAQARACVEASKKTSDWAKAQVKLMEEECQMLGQQADEDLAAMQELLANW